MKNLRKITVSILLLILILFISNGARAEWESHVPSIWMPRGFSPVLVTPGNTFQVEIEADSSFLAKSYGGILKNDLRTWDVFIEKIEKGKVRYGSKDGYLLTVRVPEGISPELFTLVLYDNEGNYISSPRSVKVEYELEEDFYILHITDEHIAPGKATKEDGHNSEKTASVEIKRWSKSVINLINPRLVVYTGDNTHTYSNSTKWMGIDTATENLIAYRDSMEGYQVATAAVAGNHDVGWSQDYVNRLEWGKVWEDIIGARAFTIRMGSFYLLCSEYSQKDYFDWTVNLYNRDYDDESIKFRLIASHFYEDSASFRPIAGEDNPCDLMIVGHNHVNKRLVCPHYPVYSTATAQKFNRTGFFEFRKEEDKWHCPQVENRQPDDVFNLWNRFGNDPVVREIYSDDNNGTAVENKVIIKNKTSKDFFNGRVRFLMARGNYQVEGGEILSQYDYGINSTAVIVKVNIKQNDTTQVSIKPQEDITNMPQDPEDIIFGT